MTVTTIACMTWDGWELTDTTRQLLALHRELAEETGHAEDAFALIAVHCEIVARLSELIAQKAKTSVSRELLIAGALAHDIGTYSVLNEQAFEDCAGESSPDSHSSDRHSSDSHSSGARSVFCKDVYIQHGLRGYRILTERGFSEDIAAFARNHTGVGITKADCIQQKLPLEPADYMPTNPVQEIVMLADKFHTKSLPPRFVSEQTARARVDKFGSENIARWDKLVACYGVPPRDVLDGLAHEYRMEIL